MPGLILDALGQRPAARIAGNEAEGRKDIPEIAAA